MHAFLLEFGISVPRGAAVISRLSTILEDNSLPLYLSQLLLKLQQHYHYLVEQIKDLESQLKRKLDEDEVGQRLLSIPCVGTLTASTISTEIGDGKQYASSRDFAAATGLVPRQYSTGGRTTLLGISKRGNKKIRTLLVQCAGIHTKTGTPVWQIGRLGQGFTVPEKQLCRHLCSGKQAGQNSLGPNGTTANLCSITAEIHRFKRITDLVLRILILMILTAHRPVEEPVKRKGSLKPYIFWRFIRRGTHQGAGIKSHSDAG